MLDLVVLERWPGFVRQAETCSLPTEAVTAYCYAGNDATGS